MISLLIPPTMDILIRHMTLAGMDTSKAIHTPSNGLDFDEEVADKALKGDNTLAIIYERGRIQKDTQSSRPIEFALTDQLGRAQTRKAIVATVPLDISIITNQISLDLDNFELLHRLELSTTTFGFILSDILHDVPKIEYTVSYSKLENKASDVSTFGKVKKGFHSYNFQMNIQGYLLAPYVSSADIVTRVEYSMGFKPDLLAFTEIIE